jgi:hypothetical protein
MCSVRGIQTSLWMGCPIRNLKVLRLHAAPLERFAGLRVLLRLQAPRHPPRTLSSLFSTMCLLMADTPQTGVDVSAFCLSSASTRAEAYASAKLKEYLFRLVRCRLGRPQPLESGNQAGALNVCLLGSGSCPVSPRGFPLSTDLGDRYG